MSGVVPLTYFNDSRSDLWITPTKSGALGEIELLVPVSITIGSSSEQEETQISDAELGQSSRLLS